ncbi:MAG: DUF1003 domain-containing protein [Candidatus Moranbacteria bacterium]|nr:DUF1003 domain-containing protein [Candidatus Moranbacteria bacterium]
MPNGNNHATLGQKAADALTKWAGSWTFIITLLLLLAIWIAANVVAIIGKWDPYPFILLNLFLSTMAAFQAPIILMSQNRVAERDRAKAAQDFAVDKKAESEIRDMQEDLEEIKRMIRKLSKEGKE